MNCFFGAADVRESLCLRNEKQTMCGIISPFVKEQTKKEVHLFVRMAERDYLCFCHLQGTYFFKA